MRGRVLPLIPTFAVFSVILLILYTPEQQQIAQAVLSKDISQCEEIKRSHFKNICYQNFYDLKFYSELKREDVNYGIFVIEALVAFFMTLFLLGKAYFSFMENWIDKGLLGKIFVKYRDLQEDSLYIFIRLPLGAFLIGALIYFESLIL